MTFAALLAATDRAALAILGGTSVTYAPTAFVGEASVSVGGIFQSPDVHATAEGTTVQMQGPAVFLRLSDLGSFDPETDDDPTVTVNGTRYRVRDVEKDGEGGAMLRLMERDES